MVEQSTTSGAFDFFLMPSGANQGCVLPTHFYVPLNESRLKKIELQQLTYALCHYYYNWSGPIKVPAPCQYAHKIADFNTQVNMGRNGRNNYGKRSSAQINPHQLNFVKQKCLEVKSLDEKLHYL